MDGERDRSRLAELRERLAAAENAFDPDALFAAMTDDIVIMPPHEDDVVGADACRAFIRDVLAYVSQEFERAEPLVYNTMELQVHDDIALERGHFTQALRPRAGGAVVRETGKYAWVWVRHNSDWKISRVIFSVHQPEDC